MGEGLRKVSDLAVALVDLLCGWLDDARAGGGRLILCRGAPGIGKTRVGRELAGIDVLVYPTISTIAVEVGWTGRCWAERTREGGSSSRRFLMEPSTRDQ
jgi:hypothetical protein